MDGKTTKFIIIGVVVIAVIAIAAYVLTNNGGGSGDDEPEAGSYKFAYYDLYADPFDYHKETKLAVLGNANGDTVIDSKDVAAIKAAIKDGDISYKENNGKYAQYYMCDANSNGIISNEDVKFVEKMISGKAETVYYEQLLEGIGSYSPAKKTYLVPVHRCYGRASVLIANASDNIKIVGGCTQMSEDEFKSTIDYSNFVEVGTSGPTSISAELITQISKDYSDGNVVVMTGGGSSYCTDYETKRTGAQYLRFISWEGDAITGLLTAAYLIDGIGNTTDGKDGTAWGKAKEFEAWYNSYIGIITEQAKKSTGITTILPYLTKEVNGVTIPGASQSSLTLRGDNTAEQLFVLNAGGENLYYEFGQPNAWGRVAYNMDQLANLRVKGTLDTVIFMQDFFVKDGTSPNGQAWDDVTIEQCKEAIADAFARYIDPSVDCYIKTWRLNGIPMIMDQICIAKVLLPDNAVIEGLDMEEIWNEYLDLLGISKTSNIRYSNVFIMDEEPFHVNAS